MDYRPQSPDLSTYAPPSPDPSGYRPQSPDLSSYSGQSGLSSPQQYFNPHQQQQRHHMQAAYGDGLAYAAPASIPQQHSYNQSSPISAHQQQAMPPQPPVKSQDDDDYMPAAPTPSTKKASKRKAPGTIAPASGEPLPDPTNGIELKTSFPVARIKRIMQADEDIGKVAQVTPHVVSRALELFMIQLISASAKQVQQSGAQGKGPKKIMAQNMKRAILEGERFDFLQELVQKVPDAPAKKSAKEEPEAEEEAPAAKSRRKGGAKKRKDSGDEF